MTATGHLVRTMTLLLRLQRSSPLTIADKINAEIDRWLSRRTSNAAERQTVLAAARTELARYDAKRQP